MNERSIAFRYLGAQKRRTGLLIFGVVLAIALISSVFSIFNALQMYEVTLYSAYGSWHVRAHDCTAGQAGALQRRLDVSSSGQMLTVTSDAGFEGKASGTLIGCDKAGALLLNFSLDKGKLPESGNAIALEAWAVQKIKPGAHVGDTIKIKIGKQAAEFVLSGIFKDVSEQKGEQNYLAAIPLNTAMQLNKTDKFTVIMQVRDGIDIGQFEKNIENDQHIKKSAVDHNGYLLAALGRSDNGAALQIYLVGGFLALLVILSAIMMIYNSFNISVMQRVRQFGLLRAMGATPKQIRKIVRSEALLVSLFGVIPGLLLGIIVSTLLVLFLRTMVPEFFVSEGPIFCVSWIALTIGGVTGILSTVLSSLSPARKAGKVSPVVAMAAAGDTAIHKKRASGIATKIIPVELALSLRRLMTRKRSFVLTSVSLSFGIILTLGFSAVTGMLSEGTQQSLNLGDISVSSTSLNSPLPDKLVASLSDVAGVDQVSSNRITTVNATFDYNLLGSEYAQSIQGNWKKVKKSKDGLVAAPSSSTLFGLSDRDLATLNGKLLFGRIDPQQLNSENGVIVAINFRGGVNISDLRPGAYLLVNGKKMKICGIVKYSSLFDLYNQNTFIGIYSTNTIFSRFSHAGPSLVTMTLKGGANPDAVYASAKKLTSGMKNVQTGDHHDTRDMINKLMLVADVFIYGFIAVIAIIGILNIINTMSTNVFVRTREIGLLRAGGMTMGQVSTMVTGESALYGLLALAIGLLAGIPLQHWFFDLTIKPVYAVPWTMPVNLIIVSSVITLLAVVLAIISPLRQIKNIVITQAVTVD